MDTLTLNDLNQFTGTEGYHKFSSLFPNVVLTDGAKHLADKAGAYWLMDIIGSVQYMLHREEFQTWTLKLNKTGSGAKVEATDGNERRIYVQRVPYTDFPLKEITLFAAKQDQYLVVMLTSEY